MPIPPFLFVCALFFLVATDAFLTPSQHYSPTSFSSFKLFIGPGFSFDDGEQVLVSVQKPLGILLEQDEGEGAPVVVVEVDPTGSAAQAGVAVGDVLVAVQNASVESQSLEYVMDFLGQAPRVVNLRFVRRQG